jgi:TPR repeat protein
MNLLGAIGLYGATAVNLGPAWADGIHWYERSAEQDNDREETTDALFELGYFYDAVVEYQTEPLEELNLSTAAAGYFTRAAERGCAGAMHSLALLQRRMQNIPDSLYWYD